MSSPQFPITAPALTLLNGEVDMMSSPLPPAVGLVHNSKVRALGVTGAQRSPLFPDLPTIAQSGLPGYECELHHGISRAGAYRGRSSTSSMQRCAPRSLCSKWHSGCDRRCRGVCEHAQGLYAADIAAEGAKWSAIVRKAGVRAE